MANKLHELLKESVETLYADDDFESFHARQRALWDAVEESGAEVHAEVLRLLREG